MRFNSGFKGLNRKHINFNRLSQQGQSRYSDQATGLTVQGSMPGRGERDFSALQNVTHSRSLNAYKGSLTGVERTEREFNHSPASSVDVKNDGSYTSRFHIFLHGVDSEEPYICYYSKTSYAVCFRKGLYFGR